MRSFVFVCVVVALSFNLVSSQICQTNGCGKTKDGPTWCTAHKLVCPGLHQAYHKADACGQRADDPDLRKPFRDYEVLKFANNQLANPPRYDNCVKAKWGTWVNGQVSYKVINDEAAYTKCRDVGFPIYEAQFNDKCGVTVANNCATRRRAYDTQCEPKHSERVGAAANHKVETERAEAHVKKMQSKDWLGSAERNCKLQATASLKATWARTLLLEEQQKTRKSKQATRAGEHTLLNNQQQQTHTQHAYHRFQQKMRMRRGTKQRQAQPY